MLVLQRVGQLVDEGHPRSRGQFRAPDTTVPVTVGGIEGQGALVAQRVAGVEDVELARGEPEGAEQPADLADARSSSVMSDSSW